MQCPPTRPGCSFMKFHFVAAASMTSAVSMPSRDITIESSLTKAMFTSRWVFSTIFEASATLIELALKVPAVMIER